MNMDIYFSKSVFFFESGWRWACRQNGSPVRSKSPWSSQTENGAGREWHRRKRGFCTFYPILHIWPNFAHFEMEMSRSLPKWHFIWTSEGKVLGSFWQSVLCMFVEWNWVQMALSAAWKGSENYLLKKCENCENIIISTCCGYKFSPTLLLILYLNEMRRLQDSSTNVDNLIR